MDAKIQEALDAIGRHDWEAVKGLLHPYLHWTPPDGARIRGRSKVLAYLTTNRPTAPPSDYELRDGQIYRWTE